MENRRKEELNKILRELTENLDLTDTEEENIRKSYKAVGEWLSDENSSLKDYDVEIRPQGSYNLGTIIRPINEDDDIDIDLVCELKGKESYWTQKNVKDEVGMRIIENDTYKKILDEEGRRCWTLLYRNNSDKERYHMDILPCVTNKGYGEIVRRMFTESVGDDYDWNKVAIRITDKDRQDYATSTNPQEWLMSNPFAYARWFLHRAHLSKNVKILSNLRESVQPLPRKSSEKLPLQRVVQIMKRHRDLYYGGDKDKPISIIITTLAAEAYNGEDSLVDALYNAVKHLNDFIQTRYSEEYGRNIKYISNPVNKEENFADKWPNNPRKEKIFYEWLHHLALDIAEILEAKDNISLKELLSEKLGKTVTEKTFSNIAKRTLNERKRGNLKMTFTGTLSTVGNIVVKAHNFYGKEENAEDEK